MAIMFEEFLFGYFGMMQAYSFVVVYISELLMCWSQGNTKIYTRSICVAERAMNKGFFVMILRDKTHIFRK